MCHHLLFTVDMLLSFPNVLYVGDDLGAVTVQNKSLSHLNVTVWSFTPLSIIVQFYHGVILADISQSE